MRERYDQIDRELLPLLPNDSECRETLGRKIPKAGNISDYVQKNASYPVYQNTDVIYYVFRFFCFRITEFSLRQIL